MELEKRQLPEEVAKEYRLVKGAPLKFVHRLYGEIDLTMVSLPLARKLVEQGAVTTLKPVVKSKPDKKK